MGKALGVKVAVPHDGSLAQLRVTVELACITSTAPMNGDVSKTVSEASATSATVAGAGPSPLYKTAREYVR